MKKVVNYFMIFMLGGFLSSLTLVIADGFGLHKHRSADIIDKRGSKVDTSRFPKKDAAETISKTWTHSGTTNFTGALQVGGTTVNSTATEFNLLAGQTALGDVSLTDANTFSGTNNFTGTFQLAGTTVSASATEINLLDGETAIGSVLSSDNNTYSGTNNFTSTFQLAGTTLSSTAAELNFLDGVSYAGGVNTCPTNFSRVGPAFGRATYCISTSEETASKWYAANDTCSDKDTGSQGPAHLCTTLEWYTACKKDADGDSDMGTFNDPIDDAEFGGEFNGSSGTPTIGNGACTTTSTIQTFSATTAPFRCCWP